jgi:general stress protein 26
MSDQLNPADVEHRLWDEIDAHGTGMLMLHEPSIHHAQPMTAFVERDARTIWFFTRTDTDLAQDLSHGGGAGMFTYQGGKLQACIAGNMRLTQDRERMNRYWNAVVAAWYPDGKDDPRLTLIEFDCQDAEVWINEAGPVKFFLEIAKANATGKTPDVGDQAHINLN